MVQKIKTKIIMVSIKKLVYSLAVMMIALVAFSSCDKNDQIDTMYRSRSSVENLLPPSQENEEDLSAVLLSAASGDCTCVDYVRNRLGLTDEHELSAENWGAILERHGYSLQDISFSNLPKKFDIIIYHKDYGYGINPDYGHIGMVATGSKSGNNIKVEVVGSAQAQSHTWSEYDCDNVSIMTSRKLNTSKVSIYRK